MTVHLLRFTKSAPSSIVQLYLINSTIVDLTENDDTTCLRSCNTCTPDGGHKMRCEIDINISKLTILTSKLTFLSTNLEVSRNVLA